MFIIKRPTVILAVLSGILIVSSSAATAENKPWWKNVQGQITVGKKEFLLGEPIFIKVTVTNRHSETIHFRDSIERCFEFSAEDNSGKSVKKLRNPDISGLFRTVATTHGTTFNDVAFISEYLDFPAPGVYTVTCRGSIRLHKGSPRDQDFDTQYVSLRGVVTVKLRRGSLTELENILRKYLTQLKSSNRRLKRQASHALTASEPMLAVKLLKEALEGKNGAYPPYTSHATWALAKIGTDEAIQALLDVAARSNNNMVRTKAIRELGRWHIKKAVPKLIDLLSDPDAKIRIDTLISLGSIGDKSCIREVESRFDDPDEKVRNVARKVHKLLNESSQKRLDAIKGKLKATIKKNASDGIK